MDLGAFSRPTSKPVQPGSLVALPGNEVLGNPQTAQELSNMVLVHYNKLHADSPLASLKFVKGAQNVILKPTASTGEGKTQTNYSDQH